MFYKIGLLTVVCLITFAFQMPGCQKVDNEMRPIGKHRDGKSDLVIIFKKNATADDINRFHMTVLLNDPSKRRKEQLPGALSGHKITQNGFKGWALVYLENSNEDQKQRLKSRIRKSLIVHKIYENVNSSNIEDL